MKRENDDERHLNCDWCKHGETVCYCRKCDVNMCAACRIKHGEIGIFTGHDVREITEMRENLLRKQEVKCDDHNHKVEYMCTETKCLKILCATCVQFDVCGHEKEGKINEIKKLLPGDRNAVRKQSIQLKQNIEALEKYYKSTTESQEEIRATKQKIEEQHHKVLEDIMKKIEEKKKRLIVQLDKAEEANQVNPYFFNFCSGK